MHYFTATAEWPRQTAFVVAGGPSVATQNLDLLKGRRVVAINSSVFSVPFADVLYFGDTRWFKHEPNQRRLAGFRGRIITTSSVVGRTTDILWMKKRQPPGLSSDRQELTARRTSLVPVINLLVHFGAAAIVLLGADGGPADDGRTHHHDPHPWGLASDCWSQQRQDLQSIVEPLRQLKIDVLNASPASRLPFWPIVKLEDALCRPDSS